MKVGDRFKAIGDAQTQGSAEKAVLLAALRWANDEGELWPSVENWARQSGLVTRSFRRVLRRMVRRGLIERIHTSAGGKAATSRYRIPALRDPARQAGPKRLETLTHGQGLIHAKHGPPMPQTLTESAPNPDRECPKPCPTVRGTVMNSKENTNEQAAAVLSRLGLERLRSHPNATPDRLAWIEREAHTKNSPAGWARRCIEEGWAVPEPSEADHAAAKRAERERRLAAFDAMPDDQRREVLHAARAQFPNLSDLPDDDNAVRGAVARIMAGRES